MEQNKNPNLPLSFLSVPQMSNLMKELKDLTEGLL